MNVASMHQKHKMEVLKMQELVKQRDTECSRLKTQVRQVESDLNRKVDALTRVETELKLAHGEVASRQEDVDRLESSVKDMKAEVSSVQKENRQLENQIGEQSNEMDHLRRELHDVKIQHKEAAQEVQYLHKTETMLKFSIVMHKNYFFSIQLAHYEEKVVIMEQSLGTTQEQLSGRVSEVVKLEQQLRRHQTEVKTLVQVYHHWRLQYSPPYSGVGKSCLLLRFTEGRFKSDHEPTLGV